MTEDLRWWSERDRCSRKNGTEVRDCIRDSTIIKHHEKDCHMDINLVIAQGLLLTVKTSLSKYHRSDGCTRVKLIQNLFEEGMISGTEGKGNLLNINV